MIRRVILFWLLSASLAWADLPRPSPFVRFCSGEFIFSQKPTKETKTCLTQPSGSWSQQYGYDSAWRLTSLTSPAGLFRNTYASSASRLVRLIALPNSASVTNYYDSMARLNYTALVNYWGHPLDGYSYQNDAWGLRTNITRQLGLTANSVAAYYDGIGELAWWTGAETNGTLRQNEQLGYAYDAANNLHYRTNGLLVQTFTDNSLNELSSVTRTGLFTETGATPAPATNITVNGATAQRYGDFTFATTNNTLANGNNTFTTIAQNVYGLKVTNSLSLNLPTPVSYQYDANGNLTNDGTRAFFYDAENQLTNVQVVSQYEVVFVYDGLNRCRIERDYAWVSGAWSKTNETRYIDDGMQVLQERDTNNNPAVTYTRGLDLSMSLNGAGGIGGLLARTDANGSTFYHGDANGDVTALMDGNQNIVARYEYDGFLRTIGRWGAMAGPNKMRASSMRFNDTDGLVEYWRRFYDPTLPRWLTADPLGEAASRNLYQPMGNNPVSHIDPYGLSWLVYPLPPGVYGPPYMRYVPDRLGNAMMDAQVYGDAIGGGLQSTDLDFLPAFLPEIPAVGKAFSWLGDELGNAANKVGKCFEKKAPTITKAPDAVLSKKNIAVYDSANNTFIIGPSTPSMHPIVLETMGIDWASNPGRFVGGFATFRDGVFTGFEANSGHFPGTPTTLSQAQAAAAVLSGAQ